VWGQGVFFFGLVAYIAIVAFAGLLYGSVALQRGLVFLHFVVWPIPTTLYTNLKYTFGASAVEKYGIENVEVESGVGGEERVVLKGYR